MHSLSKFAAMQAIKSASCIILLKRTGRHRRIFYAEQETMSLSAEQPVFICFMSLSFRSLLLHVQVIGLGGAAMDVVLGAAGLWLDCIAGGDTTGGDAYISGLTCHYYMTKALYSIHQENELYCSLDSSPLSFNIS